MPTITPTLLAIAANQHFGGFGEGLLQVFITALVLSVGAIIGAICTPFPRKVRGGITGAVAGPVALIVGLLVLFQ